jgi:hypothetical protein
MAKNWNFSQKELDVAKELANEGHQIYLLPESKNFKSADMIIDNKIGEIKHQKETTVKSISTEIYEAGRFQRARVVVLYPQENTPFENIQEALYRDVHRTPIQTIILKWQGKTWYLPRKLLMNKNWKLP